MHDLVVSGEQTTAISNAALHLSNSSRSFYYTPNVHYLFTYYFCEFSQVIKEGIRVQEFLKDYDKLRTGRMLKTVFERGLDLANLGLQPTEVAILKY